MTQARLKLQNRLGLHARAASKLVQAASRFESKVELNYQGKTVNAKSIMGVLLLGAPCGAELTVQLDGPDAEAALAALQDLVADRFGEGE